MESRTKLQTEVNGEWSFLALGEEIDRQKHIIARYYLESEMPMEKAAQILAAEESTGTWTAVGTEDIEIRKRHGAKVVSVEGNLVQIAFPLENFCLGNIPVLLATVAGNLFGMDELKNVRLLDLEMPRKFARSFPTPRFGIKGVRKILRTKGRPHLGTIIKPKIGLKPKKFAQVCYEAGVGGVDFLKDDETLVDQDFCKFRQRADAVAQAIDKAERETGRKIMHAINVSDHPLRALEKAEYAKKAGSKCVMVDLLTCGFTTLQLLAEEIKLPIHVHRTMHGALTRNKKHGIHMLPIAKLARLCGADQLHTGTVAGKMEGQAGDLIGINDFLRQEYYGMKQVFPVASGGVHPGYIEANLKVLGKDAVINLGGGIHGHPDGTRAGAQAAREAVDAFLEGIPTDEYAKTHPALGKAIEKWGYVKA